MSISDKINALNHLFHVLEEIHVDKAPFCHRGCSACCTQKVTMTTLEGYFLYDYLIQNNRDQTISYSFSPRQKHQSPNSTINTWAKRCAENNEQGEPNLTADTPLGVCPWLAEQHCSIYPARPLACRIMVSQKDCRISGMAHMEPFDVTLNHVMMQFVEHIDQHGLTGQMGDVMTYLSRDDHRHSYKTTGTLVGPKGLLQNQPLTVLMVPPEHRRMIGPILKKLNPTMGTIL